MKYKYANSNTGIGDLTFGPLMGEGFELSQPWVTSAPSEGLSAFKHALCTASGHADPASTVFRPFGASCMPAPAPSRDGPPSPKDVTAVTTNPVTGGSSLPVSCLLGDRNALSRASPALSM